jgi:ubiquinone/menaquinone biosynthesis C-methylase UbiE
MYIQSYLDLNPGLTNDVSIEHVFVSSEWNLEPISDNSVDAVVGTFILCSAARVNLVLSEIKRILVPVSRNLE